MARFEIKLLDICVVHGQGVSEGAFEMQVKAVLHPGDKAIEWPDLSGDPLAYRKVPASGAVVAIDRVIDVVSVAHNETKTVTVDLRLTEVDGGLNGKNDFANYSVDFDLTESSGTVTVGPVATLWRPTGATQGRVKVRVTARRL